MKMTIIMCVLYFAIGLSFGYGQDTVKYTFVWAGDTNSFQPGASTKITYKRIYKGPIIEEHGLLSTKRGITYFLVIGDNWYIKTNGEWEIFYSKVIEVIPKIEYHEHIVNLIPIGKEKIGKWECIIYPEPNVIFGKPIFDKGDIIEKTTRISHTRTYWFSPELGIIGIGTGSSLEFIREDIKKQL